MNKEIILMDTNALAPRSFISSLYGINKYSQIPLGHVVRANTTLTKSFILLGDKSRLVTSDVLDELLDFQEIVIEKVKFLDSRKYGVSDEARYQFQLMNSSLNKLIKKAKKSQYKPSSSTDYEKMSGLAIKLGKELALKKKRKLYSNKAEFRTTDEKLAATAFYIPLFEKNGAEVLTDNPDIFRLSTTIYYLFTNGLSKGYAEMVKERLSQTKAKISYYDGSGNNLVFPSDAESPYHQKKLNKFQEEARQDIEAIIQSACSIRD